MFAELTEQTLRFDCQGAALLGVLSLPAQAPAPALAVVIVVGGPQYRAGSHRQFVLLARAIARAGHAALRFDYRGMGDSAGDLISFENSGDDIASAIRATREALPSVKQVVLWGLCDGASAALMYAQNPPSGDAPAALALANPWVRTDATLARAQVKHYYAQRLFEPDFWVRLATGKVPLSSLRDWRHSLAGAARPLPAEGEAPPYVERMAQAWRNFSGPILLLLSGHDLVAQEFLEATTVRPQWHAALSRPRLTRADLPGADHTFSDTSERETLEKLTCNWLAQLPGLAAPVVAHAAAGSA